MLRHSLALKRGLLRSGGPAALEAARPRNDSRTRRHARTMPPPKSID